MAKSILLIQPSPETQALYQELYQDISYSAGFYTVLNKYGLLSYDTLTHEEAFSTPDYFHRYDIVLLSHLPDPLWQDTYLKMVQNFNGHLFIEAPIPTQISHYLAAESEVPITSHDFMCCRPEEEALKEFLESEFTTESGQYLQFYSSQLYSEHGIPLNRRRYKVLGDSQRQADDSELKNLTSNLQRRIKSFEVLLHSYEKKYEITQRFSNNTEHDALTLLALSIASPDWFKSEYGQTILNSLIETQPDLLTSDNMNDLLFCQILSPQAPTELNISKQVETLWSKMIASIKLETTILGLLRSNDSFKKNLKFNKTLGKLLPFLNSSKYSDLWPYDLLLTLWACPEQQAQRLEQLNSDCPGLIHILKNSFVSSKSTAQFYQDSNRSTRFFALLILADLLGVETKYAQQFIDEQMICSSSGRLCLPLLSTSDIKPRTPIAPHPWHFVALAYFLKTHCAYLPKPFSRHVKTWSENELLFKHLSSSGILYHPLLFTESHMLFSSTDAEHRELGPMVSTVTKNQTQFTLFHMPVFSYLASYHLVPPIPGTYMHVEGGQFCDALERVLLHLILKASPAHRPMPIVMPWPNNQPFSVCIRRDVDRPLKEEDYTLLSELDQELSLKASWFWLNRNIQPDILHKIIHTNSENAWHAECWLEGQDTPTQLSGLSEQGMYFQGVSVHGGQNADGWRGQFNLEQYCQWGLDYSDTPGAFTFFPYQPLTSGATGIKTMPILCLPTHCSFDKNNQETFAEVMDETFDSIKKLGGNFTFMHHPDLHQQAVQQTLRTLIPVKSKTNTDGSKLFTSFTQYELSDWWQKSHNPKILELSTLSNLEGEYIQLISQQPLENLAIALPITDLERGQYANTKTFRYLGLDCIEFITSLTVNCPKQIKYTYAKSTQSALIMLQLAIILNPMTQTLTKAFSLL